MGRPPSATALVWTLIGLGGLAGGSLLQGRLLGRGGPTALTAVQVAAGAVTTAFWAPFGGSLRIPETASALASFGWLAWWQAWSGRCMLLALIGRHGPTRGTSLLFLVPSFTAFFGWLLLGERVGRVALLGLGIAGFGLWLGGVLPAAAASPAPVAVRSRRTHGARAPALRIPVGSRPWTSPQRRGARDPRHGADVHHRRSCRWSRRCCAASARGEPGLDADELRELQREGAGSPASGACSTPEEYGGMGARPR